MIASNDMTTIGALQAIRDHKLSIPAGIAIIDFDEMAWTLEFSKHGVDDQSVSACMNNIQTMPIRLRTGGNAITLGGIKAT